MMDKCPACGADTRPGDNYCLNCGQRLLTSTPSPVQAQPGMGDPMGGSPNNDWGAPAGIPSSWAVDAHAPTMAAAAPDLPTFRAEPAPVAQVAQATLDRIQEPARFILKSDTGEDLQEYPLDKPEIVIGRAPTSDILLSKDKLISRRHAVVRYENGQYILHDEHSANGTFVNQQQLEEGGTQNLRDNDKVGIGEHELIFRAFGSASSAVEDLPTVAVPHELTWRTQPDQNVTIPDQVEPEVGGFETMPEYAEPQAEPVAETPAPAVQSSASVSSDVVSQPAPVEPEPAQPAPVVNSEATMRGPAKNLDTNLETPAPAPAPVTQNPIKATPATSPTPVASRASEGGDSSVSFQRLTTLAQPALPDMSGLMAALSTLDGQVMALQEQFNSLQEGMRSHEAELAQTSGQLRSGIRRVAERMDGTIADVARSRETLAWAELLQLMEDVMNNPRDIEYVTRLARKARELNKVFQIHQNVLNTMAECNSLLRSMIGDEK